MYVAFHRHTSCLGDQTLQQMCKPSTNALGMGADLATYVNYAHGDETLEQRCGARKLPQLARLKAKGDPKGMFRFNNVLPTKYP